MSVNVAVRGGLPVCIDWTAPFAFSDERHLVLVIMTSKSHFHFDTYVAGLRLGPLLALLWHSVREVLCHDDDTNSSNRGSAAGSDIGSGSFGSDRTTEPKYDEPAMAVADAIAEEKEEEGTGDDNVFKPFPLPFIPHGMGGSALPPIAPQRGDTSPLQAADPPKHEPAAMMALVDGVAVEAEEEGQERHSMAGRGNACGQQGERRHSIATGTACGPFHLLQSLPSYAGDGPIARQSTGGTSHVPGGPNDSADTWVQLSSRRASISNVFVEIDEAAARTTPTPLAVAHVHLMVHQSRQQGLLAWAPDGRRCQLEALGPLFEEYRTLSPLTATFFLALVLR